MSTFKSLLHAKCNAEVRAGYAVVVLTLLMLTTPRSIPPKCASTIDDAMPASFPKEVSLMTWKDQDKIVAPATMLQLLKLSQVCRMNTKINMKLEKAVIPEKNSIFLPTIKARFKNETSRIRS
jgi:hypothetical protein